jgi:hypothetical protein
MYNVFTCRSFVCRTRFEQLASPAVNRPSDISCQSTAVADPFDTASLEVGRRQPSTAALAAAGISRLQLDSASFNDENCYADSKNADSETKHKKVDKNDDEETAAELNDVIRQSEILKSVS